jgi:hypothetical protein
MGRPLSQDSAVAAGIIDVAHLTRVTFGEKVLATEVLGLFDRQAEMLLARMQQASPRDLAACAHTLAGSARGVGAWGVAAASVQVELPQGMLPRSASLCGASRRPFVQHERRSQSCSPLPDPTSGAYAGEPL